VPANAAPLAHVDEEPDVRVMQRAEEAVECPALDADGHERARQLDRRYRVRSVLFSAG
jgi:hypothetical protein